MCCLAVIDTVQYSNVLGLSDGFLAIMIPKNNTESIYTSLFLVLRTTFVVLEDITTNVCSVFIYNGNFFPTTVILK